MTFARSLRSYSPTVILSFLLFFSIYQLLVVMMHDLVQQELRGWQATDYSAASYNRWQNQQALVELLVTIAPYHGEVLQSSSRFYQLGSHIASGSSDQQQHARQHQQQALQLIRQSLSKQPSWPLAWMDLAFIKSTQQQLDEEFQQAFSMALKTGAAEEYILLGMTEIGLAYWRDLSADNRIQFLQFLELAMVREPQQVVTSAEYYRRSYVVCRLITSHAAIKDYCAKR